MPRAKNFDEDDVKRTINFMGNIDLRIVPIILSFNRFNGCFFNSINTERNSIRKREAVVKVELQLQKCQPGC